MGQAITLKPEPELRACRSMASMLRLIVEKFSHDDRNTIRTFVMQQFSQLNLANKMVSSEDIA